VKYTHLVASGVALAASFLASEKGHAQCFGSLYICYDNIAAASSGTELVKSTGLFNSFTTGSSSQAIAEVDFLLDGGGNFNVSVLSNNADNTPANVLFSESFFALPSFGVQYFFPNDLWIVQANTRYWIMLLANGPLQWSYSSDVSSSTTVADEYWSDGAGVYANSSSRGPFQMDLGDGGVPLIPEPSTWAMMLLGFAGLGFAGYRRARAGHATARGLAR
jgi:hypothetical protein